MNPFAEMLELVATTRAQVERDRVYLQQLWRRLSQTEIVIRDGALALQDSNAKLEAAEGGGPVMRPSRPP